MQTILDTNPSTISVALTIARSYGWACGAITVAGWLPWLQSLPLEHHLVLPDGKILLGIHAAPGKDDGDGIHPDLTPDALRAILQASTNN